MIRPGRVPYFILNGKRPEACADPLRWSAWCFGPEGHENRKVAATVLGEVVVSTVFLGLDHNYSEKGPPILFETMIFNHGNNEYQRRYSTYEQAEAGHAFAVELLTTQLEALRGASEDEARKVIARAMAKGAGS